MSAEPSPVIPGGRPRVGATVKGYEGEAESGHRQESAEEAVPGVALAGRALGHHGESCGRG